MVFTGDLIDKDSIIVEDDIKYLKSALSKINAKYAKYAVMGNHDYNKIETVENIYNDAGFNYLNNSYISKVILYYYKIVMILYMEKIVEKYLFQGLVLLVINKMI